MDEVNDDFAGADVVMVIDANDAVNLAALTEPGSPIAGMPVLKAWEAGHVIAFKRSTGNGLLKAPKRIVWMPWRFRLRGPLIVKSGVCRRRTPLLTREA